MTALSGIIAAFITLAGTLWCIYKWFHALEKKFEKETGDTAMRVKELAEIIERNRKETMERLDRDKKEAVERDRKLLQFINKLILHEKDFTIDERFAAGREYLELGGNGATEIYFSMLADEYKEGLREKETA